MASEDSTKGVKEILQERGSTHGPFDMQAQATQQLKSVFYSFYELGDFSNDATIREAVDMILHKLARIAVGNPYFEDHWKDIAGYASLPPKYRKMVKVKVVPDND
jgi:hypothetical protein